MVVLWGGAVSYERGTPVGRAPLHMKIDVMKIDVMNMYIREETRLLG